MVNLSRKPLGHQWSSPHRGRHLWTEGFLYTPGIYFWKQHKIVPGLFATLLLVSCKCKFYSQMQQLSDYINQEVGIMQASIKSIKI